MFEDFSLHKAIIYLEDLQHTSDMDHFYNSLWFFCAIFEA